jgi:hypothetical protein
LPVGLVNFSQTDPLRTHCPGPEFSDVFGTDQTFAATQVARRQLLQRRTVIALNPRGRFGAPGYAGARGGGVRLSLSLVNVSAGTQSEALS